MAAMTSRSMLHHLTLKRSAGCALAALVALLGVAFPAAPAWAHAKLLSTDPAAGATVATAVTTITLTFNEPVRQQMTTVTVTGPDGVSYSDGNARSVDKQVLQGVKPLPAGAIRVVWKTVSPDGDPIQGTFAFSNAAAPPTSAAPSPSPAQASASPQVPAPAVSSLAPNARAASDDQGSDGLVWWLVAAAIVLVALTAGAFWFRRRGLRSGSQR
jgi:methionine-rich copper-binding protein CopC